MERLSTMMSRAYVSQLDPDKIPDRLFKLRGRIDQLSFDQVIKQLSKVLPDVNVFPVSEFKIDLNDDYFNNAHITVSPGGKYIVFSSAYYTSYTYKNYLKKYHNIIINLQNYLENFQDYPINQYIIRSKFPDNKRMRDIKFIDNTHFIYRDNEDVAFVYNIVNVTATKVNFPYNYNTIHIGNILINIKESEYKLTVYKWVNNAFKKLGSIENIGHMLIKYGSFNKLSNLLLKYQSNLSYCETFIQMLTDNEFTRNLYSVFTKNDKIEDIIFSIDCKFIIVIYESNLLRVMKKVGNSYILVESTLPIKYQEHDEPISFANVFITSNNLLIVWNEDIIYSYDLELDQWKSLIQTSGKNGIYTISTHSNGLLIRYSPYQNYDEGENTPIIGTPLILPLVDNFPNRIHENIFANYDFELDRITFYLENYQYDSDVPMLIYKNLIFLNTRNKPVNIYDENTNILPYNFDLKFNDAETLLIDTKNIQFKLLPYQIAYFTQIVIWKTRMIWHDCSFIKKAYSQKKNQKAGS